MATFASVQIRVNDRIYLRDPEQTELGRRIIEAGIKLIEKIGFEQFTFKKLANEIKSTEASIYRYFENKHKLLTYLVSWYWAWLEYQVEFQTHNIEDPKRRLQIALRILSDDISYDPQFSHVDESLLHKIVVAESSKSYLTKEVDADNREGFFLSYKSLTKKVADIVEEVNPGFKYPRALVSTMIEASHQQKYFSQHLPSLTEIKVLEGGDKEILEFLEYTVFGLIDRQ
ncbi:MAG TPA: TetR family transcriptional regulator [Cytophagales bacterium]|nr:TetR family transcriptional regulator [Cytophagales bacterium]HAA23396.1 TetR family transcriptional regulator [Cytophagales bacterium]HAP58123.1 TetR family transcriptional regulator [Cytophagales bacterium]